MQAHIPAFQAAKVLVVGDVMLDRYWHGSTQRISPEAPVPVVHVQDCQALPGGAGNVGLNLASLGVDTTLLGLVGEDEAGTSLREQLQQAGIHTHLLPLADKATITKLRVLSLHQQLIRLDFEDSFAAIDHHPLLNTYQQALNNAQVVVLSDYGKGTLQQVQTLITQAQQRAIPVLVDPKGTDFSIYRGAEVITPNRKEFEAVVGKCANDTELLNKAENLINAIGVKSILVTRGAEGMSLIRQGQAPVHLSAQAFEVFDVTGAGDTVIATLAASLAAGSPIEEAMHLANTAAGLVVRKLGAASVSVSELRRELRREASALFGVLTQAQAQVACEEAKAQGKKVVMTNGCFDILHPGHIEYLEQAKACGDRLIVAVNTDESVRRIKGASRPLNTLQDRMAVLAGLRAVDWVVPFAEDTPAQIIQQLTPDVLVKGVDYRLQDIVGREHVLAHGGEVKLVGPDKNWSSTEIIAKAKSVEESIA
jgi:D-beta-D-heptose 7-phosphate kinase/D-beta-D-heptose 1-phosphate adenosyltransferase